MNNTFRNIVILSMAACSLSFLSCSKEEGMDMNSGEGSVSDLTHIDLYAPADEGNLKYVKDGIFITDANEEVTVLPVRCATPVTEDISLTVKIKPISVEYYNLYHNTNYKSLSSGEIINPTLTIKKGETQSTEPIRLRFSNMSEFQDAMTNHMIALTVDSLPKGYVGGECSELLLNFNKVYRPNPIQLNTHINKYGLSVGDGRLNNLNSEIIIEDAVLASRPAEEKITVSLAIDETLVAAYNKEKGTNYKMFPNVSLKETTIELMESEGNHGLTLLFSDGMASVKDGNDYIVPVVIKKTEGAGAVVGEESVTYVRFTSDAVFTAVLKDSPEGQKIEDFTGWEVTVNGEASGYWGDPWTNILKGQRVEAYYGSQPMVIDMKSLHKIKSVQWVTSASWYYLESIKIGISTDGEDYEEVDLKMPVLTSTQNVVFSVPEEIRFIRINTSGTASPGGVYIYSSNE